MVSRPGAPAPARRPRLSVEVVTRPAFPVRGLAPWLVRTAPLRARGDITVAFVTDRRMAALNGIFRGKPTVTDVLSFPSGGGPHLGDVVIATGMARRQARQAGHSLAVEVRVLALHGLLHLLGYDHEDDEGQMGRLERRLRRKGGLVEGLIERAASPDRLARAGRSRLR